MTYRGGGPAVQGLLAGGEMRMTFQTAATVPDFMRSGDLRALAVAGRKRIPFTPDLPTFPAIIPTVRPPEGFPAFAAAESAGWRDLIGSRNIRVQRGRSP